MNRRAATLVPILLGGTAGALFGLFEAFTSAAPEGAQPGAETVTRGPSAAPSPSSLATASVGAAIGEALPSASSVAKSASSVATNASSVATIASSAATSTSAAAVAPTPSANASSAPALRRAFDLAEPATQEALLAAQVACNRASPEDCERAALALESGSLGVKDSPRARSLRRIALTAYVKQCETGRALACARLAEMYDVGDIVQVNPRNAQALRTRVSELCAKHPNNSDCLP